MPCDAKTINAYYDLKDEQEPDDYENLLKALDLDELLHFSQMV